jgi:23S rRNA (cytosine1962-C5)-methyltransferase
MRGGVLPELRLAVRVRGRHPWFYRKMVRKPDAPLPPGGAVRVFDRDGRFVGVGLYNRHAELALRMLAREEVEDVDALLARLLDSAIELRERVLDLPRVTDAYRLVHGDGDGLPGLTLDRLGTAIVAQVSTRGMLARLEPIGERLLARHPGARLVLTVDREAAAREAMEVPPRSPPVEVDVIEHGIAYGVRAGGSHKTGFFCDQRDNRQLVRRLARGRAVLDLCCHAGGFALAAAAGGAREVTAVDLDEGAVDEARANAARNRLDVDVRHGDAFDALRAAPAAAHDLVVLDPPKWVPDRKALEAGLPRYRDLNRLALAKVARGGLLVTCSCSGPVSPERFEATVREAAAEAGRDARILCRAGAAPDHPIALECPETAYLKVLVLEVR